MSRKRTIVLGVGCNSRAGERELSDLVSTVLKAGEIEASDIAYIATIDNKKHETAIHALTRELDVPLRLFAATALNREEERISAPSAIARDAVGTASVSEAAALAAAGAGASLLVTKRKSANCTAAIAVSTSRISGQNSTSRKAKAGNA